MNNNEIVFFTSLVFLVIYQAREINRLKKRVEMLGDKVDTNFFSEEENKEKANDKKLKDYFLIGVTTVVIIMLLIIIYGKLNYG